MKECVFIKNRCLKNIDAACVLPLAQLVEVLPGQVVSKTFVQNDGVGITLFAFAPGEEISTHGSEGDALVQVLEGTGRFVIDGKEHLVSAGEVLVMPATVPHAVYAPQAFKMLLTVVFPQNNTV